VLSEVIQNTTGFV